MITKEELKALLQNDLDTVKPEHYIVVPYYKSEGMAVFAYAGDDYNEVIDVIHDNLWQNEHAPKIAGNILITFIKDIDDSHEECKFVEFDSKNNYLGLKH